MIDDIDQIVAGERFTLVGYSMGGRIALHAALMLGGRIERLVLIGASPGIADKIERETAYGRMRRWRGGSRPRAASRRWQGAGSKPRILEGQPPKVAAFVHANRLLNTPAGLARALRGLGTGVLPSAWEHLGELQIPVVLVVGERDEKFIAVAEQMAALIDWCEIVTVPDVGHAVHLEDPAAVARVLHEALTAASRLGDSMASRCALRRGPRWGGAGSARGGGGWGWIYAGSVTPEVTRDRLWRH